MKLNGWQRLWVFVSAPFFIGSLVAAAVVVIEGKPPTGPWSKYQPSGIARVQLPDGRVARLEVPEGMTREEFTRRLPDTLPQGTPGPWTILEDTPERHGDMWLKLWIALATGIGFPAFMYATGWGVAWVRRGFRR